MTQNKLTRKIRQKGWNFRPYRFDREKLNRFFNKEMKEELGSRDSDPNTVAQDH
jgi:hypothetical protein